MQGMIDWKRIQILQAELGVIANRNGNGFAALEAASDALFFFIENPESSASPVGVFRNCLRDIKRTLLQ